MSNYTELVLKVTVNRHAPSQVCHILQYLFGEGKGEKVAPSELPDHPFFKCSRWKVIGSGNSCCHVPWSSSKFEGGHIFSRSDFENGELVLEKFIDWLAPFIWQTGDECVGWAWFDEDYGPELLTVNGVRELLESR